jgi:hypothetical protein
MTASQYRMALSQLGFKHHTAARLLSTSRRQSLRYARGQARIPDQVERFLVALLRLSSLQNMHHYHYLEELGNFPAEGPPAIFALRGKRHARDRQ